MKEILSFSKDKHHRFFFDKVFVVEMEKIYEINDYDSCPPLSSPSPSKEKKNTTAMVSWKNTVPYVIEIKKSNQCSIKS